MPNITINLVSGVKTRDAWSEAAREAAAKARRDKASHHADLSKAHAAHGRAAEAKGDKGSAWVHGTAAVLHGEAAKRYTAAANSTKQSEATAHDKKAQSAANHAEQHEAFHNVKAGRANEPGRGVNSEAHKLVKEQQKIRSSPSNL